MRRFCSLVNLFMHIRATFMYLKQQFGTLINETALIMTDWRVTMKSTENCDDHR